MNCAYEQETDYQEGAIHCALTIMHRVAPERM